MASAPGGKVPGPAGLAVIMGAGDIIKPAAPNLVMLGPAFIYFASGSSSVSSASGPGNQGPHV
jgi:hypothetical protein